MVEFTSTGIWKKEDQKRLEDSVSLGDPENVQKFKLIVENSPEFQEHRKKHPDARLVLEPAREQSNPFAPGPVAYGSNKSNSDNAYGNPHSQHLSFAVGCCEKQFTVEQGEKGINVSYSDGPSMLKDQNRDQMAAKGYGTGPKNTSSSGTTLLYDNRKGSGNVSSYQNKQ